MVGAGIVPALPPESVLWEPVELTLTLSVAPGDPAPACDVGTAAIAAAAAATAHLRRPVRALVVRLLILGIPSDADPERARPARTPDTSGREIPTVGRTIPCLHLLVSRPATCKLPISRVRRVYGFSPLR